MRRVTSLFAALLSLLLISTSASASACDLSCSFHEVHYGCQTAKSGTRDKQSAMFMSPDMDMSSEHSEDTVRPASGVVATPEHPKSMSSRMEMPAGRFERVMKPQTGTRAMPDHSQTLSSCSHEPCSQISAFVSPSKNNCSQPKSLHWIAIIVLSPLNPNTRSHRIRVQTTPPNILAVDLLATTLRI